MLIFLKKYTSAYKLYQCNIFCVNFLHNIVLFSTYSSCVKFKKHAYVNLMNRLRHVKYVKFNTNFPIV